MNKEEQQKVLQSISEILQKQGCSVRHDEVMEALVAVRSERRINMYMDLCNAEYADDFAQELADIILEGL